MTREEAESYKEVLEIINNMEEKYKLQIPQNIIDDFEKNCAKDYNFKIDLKKTLKEQKLKSKTLAILGFLDLNYWCESDEERKQVLEDYKERKSREQAELRDKYNPENLFRKHEKEEQTSEEKEQQLVSNNKEPFLKRIINKIKRFFVMY